jgi:hypothetical protein
MFRRFVYSGSGELGNIENFEQAHALFMHATLLGLNALKNVAKAYIFSSIKPSTVWKVLQLANDTTDESLKKAAWFVSKTLKLMEIFHCSIYHIVI